jgi:glycosyltransferase involved in cell wall biosynthesis
MTQKHIAVLESVHLKPTLDPETMVITIGDLGDWVRSGKIISHLFRYKEVVFHVSDYRQIIRPFLCFLFLKLVCRGNCYVQDTKENHQPITLFLLISHFFEFLKEGIQIPFCLLRHNKTIKKLNNQSKPGAPPLNLSLPPLYLRTDRAVGVMTGGAMGHTIGVINNLEKFTAKPILVATLQIPTFDPKIIRHEIKLEQQFRNFDNILLLASTDLIFKETLSKFGDIPFSFIYQRYSNYNYSGVLIAQKLKIPFVLEFNSPANWASANWEKDLGYEGLAENVELLNVNLADVVVVVSKPLQDILVHQGANPEKILINPNGVDPNRYSPDQDGLGIRKKFNLENKITIGFIGTFGKWHGAEVLARAYGLLLETYPDYRKTTHLLLIGDGVTMPQVKNEIEYFCNSDNVTLTGIVPQEQGPEYLAACDLLASPHVPNSDGTPFFGSPTKLFEYMAMGKGIIASDLEQIGEVLEHDLTAWMVKPGDAESLMHGLKIMIDNPDISKRLGEAARREAIAKYSWKEHTRKIIEKLKERCSDH